MHIKRSTMETMPIRTPSIIATPEILPLPLLALALVPALFVAVPTELIAAGVDEGVGIGRVGWGGHGNGLAAWDESLWAVSGVREEGERTYKDRDRLDGAGVA
jgi:hypothetical protein